MQIASGLSMTALHAGKVRSGLITSYPAHKLSGHQHNLECPMLKNQIEKIYLRNAVIVHVRVKCYDIRIVTQVTNRPGKITIQLFKNENYFFFCPELNFQGRARWSL